MYCINNRFNREKKQIYEAEELKKYTLYYIYRDRRIQYGDTLFVLIHNYVCLMEILI